MKCSKHPAIEIAASLAIEEAERATGKFPTWPTDPLHALGVLAEEFGKLSKEVVQMTYEPHKSTLGGSVREEAIQTAAMALRFLASVDEYEFTPGTQHSQESDASAIHRCDYGCYGRNRCPETATWHNPVNRLYWCDGHRKPTSVPLKPKPARNRKPE